MNESIITPEELTKLLTNPKYLDEEWRNGGRREALSKATTMVKIEHGKALERFRILDLIENQAVLWDGSEPRQEAAAAALRLISKMITGTIEENK